MLNTRFVNTWVLMQELPELAEQAESEDVRRLAKALHDVHPPKSPVDCVLLSPRGQVLLVRPVHDLLLADRLSARRYKAFLATAPESSKSQP